VEAIVALPRGLLPALLARQGGVINVASQMVFQPMPVSKPERRRLT
jgi:short-subunit dehydrogenase